MNNSNNDTRKKTDKNITTARQLFEKNLICEKDIDTIQKVIDEYPMSITEYYLSLIKKNDYTDPVYKMCIPSVFEQNPAGCADTSGEGSNTVSDGIQHKYDNTVLLLSTNVCAMYCRHCFRKRLVGQSEEEILSFINDAVAYIKEHPEVDNVLITGGDSLMLSNRAIEKYLKELTAIPHLKFIRFGTRVPVVFPERILADGALVDMLQSYRRLKPIYIVTQFNHINEITPLSAQAIKLFRTAGIPVLNQTVLLKGVNASADALVELFNGLIEIGISPYYLFQCRPVKGVKDYFAVSLSDGVKIVDEARARLSGPAKRFRYAMSHITGKMEIIGETKGGRILIKQHQAKQNNNLNRLISVKIDKGDSWIADDFEFDIV